MIVVQVRPDLSFEVIDREKEMVRLGAGGLDGRSLTPTAMTAALQALSKFRRLAESHKVDEIIAAATSATREAENGGDFIAEVERADRHPDPGHLRHRRGAADPPGRGLRRRRRRHRRRSSSTSAAAASRSRSARRRSLDARARASRLGVIRLTERFVKTDPLAGARRAPAGEASSTARSAAYLDQIARRGFDRVIGTSGTILSLGALALARRRAATRRRTLRNRRVTAKALRRLRKRLVGARSRRAAAHARPRSAPRRSRGRRRGPARHDPPPARRRRDHALRPGAARRPGARLHPPQHARGSRKVERYPDVRRRSVIELGERCSYWPEHAQQVARLALSHLRPDAQRPRPRPIASASGSSTRALLHDIGVHISYERHHRHSYYLIKNGDLRGFEPRGDRGHRARRALSSAGDAEEIARGLRRSRAARCGATVRTLAAILRLAEGLDRSHAQAITGVDLLPARRRLPRCSCATTGDAELELWAAHRHVRAVRTRCSASRIRFEVAGADYKERPPHAEQPDHAARVPGKAVRRRGDRRVGKDDAAGAAGEVAERRGPPRVRHRMELVGAGQGGDQDRQEEERADADDVQPAARHRLRRPAALQHHPAAQGRHDRAGRSLRLHRVRARRGARRRSAVGARAVQLRGPPGPGASTSACRSTSRSTG